VHVAETRTPHTSPNALQKGVRAARLNQALVPQREGAPPASHLILDPAQVLASRAGPRSARLSSPRVPSVLVWRPLPLSRTVGGDLAQFTCHTCALDPASPTGASREPLSDDLPRRQGSIGTSILLSPLPDDAVKSRDVGVSTPSVSRRRNDITNAVRSGFGHHWHFNGWPPLVSLPGVGLR